MNSKNLYNNLNINSNFFSVIPDFNLSYYTKEPILSASEKRKIEISLFKESFNFLEHACQREKQTLTNMKHTLRRLGEGKEKERIKANIKKFEMESCAKYESLKRRFKESR